MICILNYYQLSDLIHDHVDLDVRHQDSLEHIQNHKTRITFEKLGYKYVFCPVITRTVDKINSFSSLLFFIITKKGEIEIALTATVSQINCMGILKLDIIVLFRVLWSKKKKMHFVFLGLKITCSKFLQKFTSRVFQDLMPNILKYIYLLYIKDL